MQKCIENSIFGLRNAKNTIFRSIFRFFRKSGSFCPKIGHFGRKMELSCSFLDIMIFCKLQWLYMCETRCMDRISASKGQKYHFWIDFSYFRPKFTILAQIANFGRFQSEKIKNHHMGNCRHIDMFSRTESHPEIDSAWLEI